MVKCLISNHLIINLNETVSLFTMLFLKFYKRLFYFHQVLFNPRKTLGIGLTDGEGMERLWSYLGKFSSITKEMTPENRIDLLTDALIYYGQKKKQKLGK